MRACGWGTMHVMGPYKFVLHDFAHRGYTWHSYDLTIEGPVGHVLMLLWIHGRHCIPVQAYHKNRNANSNIVTTCFQDLTGKRTIVVSGHHGQLHIDGLRFIIDEGGGYEDKPIAAIVFPSKTLIRSTEGTTSQDWTGCHDHEQGGAVFSPLASCYLLLPVVMCHTHTKIINRCNGYSK